MEVTIRNLQKKEYNQGLSLFCKAMGFPELVGSLVDAANFYHDRNHLELIGLFSNEQQIGFGSIVFHEDCSWIPWVGVDPDYQGNGIGKKVMNHLLSMLKGKGRATVELCATDAGFPLYEKLGFQYEYRTDILNVKGSKDVQLQNGDELLIQTISTGDPLPEWVLKLDKENMAIKREQYLGYHFSDEFVIIGAEGKGYGMVTGKRVGPLISKDIEFAKNIFQSALDIGIETVIPVELPGKKSFMWDLAELEIFVPCRKMTFGPLPGQMYNNIFAIRSTALG